MCKQKKNMEDKTLKELEDKVKTTRRARDAAEFKYLNAQREWQDYKLEHGEPLNPTRKRAAAAGGEGENAPAAAPGKAKNKSKEAAPPKKQKAAAVQQDSDWVCAGNVITGDPHDGDSEAHRTRAPNTKFNGKTYTSCRACKKDMKKAKKAVKTE